MKNCGCGGKSACGCCKGVETVTPLATANRPGLGAISYRIGTHAAFLESMQARLSGPWPDSSVPGREGPPPPPAEPSPLAGLRTRSPRDFSIALLDAAATMMDVLTFYQERIANEGYLPTATERLSIIGLGRLVGYKPRPGVAASVYLAYTVDDQSEPVVVPKQALARSVPGQDEQAQAFETSEKLEARKEWNNLAARRSRPQRIVASNAKTVDTIYFQGTETNLKPNDPLLFVFDVKDREPVLRKVKTVEALFEEKKTRVTLQAASLFGPLLAVFEKYRENSKAYGLDDQNELVASALKNLEATSFMIAMSIGVDLEVGIKIGRLVINIDESGNKCFQKWLFSLVEEIAGILLESDRAEEIIRGLAIDSAIPENEDVKKAIGILRRVDAFDTLLRRWLDDAIPAGSGKANAAATSPFKNLLQFTVPLTKPPSRQPRNSVSLDRDVRKVLDDTSDNLPKIFTSFKPALRDAAYQAWGKSRVPAGPAGVPPAKIYALRTTAPLFGSSVLPRILEVDRVNGRINRTGEYPIVEIPEINEIPGAGTPGPKPVVIGVAGTSESDPPAAKGTPEAAALVIHPIRHENENNIFLDSIENKILPGSWTVVDTSGVDAGKLQQFSLAPQNLVFRVSDVKTSISRNEYGLSTKTTLLTLDKAKPWLKFRSDAELIELFRKRFAGLQTLTQREESVQRLLNEEFNLVRRTVVHTQSEELELAEEPVGSDVCGGEVELGVLQNGLESGRWVIVSGERTDIPGVTGVMGAELVMLRDIRQDSDPNLPGDKTHSTLVFANKLAYTYLRDTVVIYGNVVKATHGETRSEVLGSGDAAKALQSFVLRQPPLTYVPAPTAEGIESTLHVFVNDVEWHETDSLAGAGRQDRSFVTMTGDDAKTTVVFGNGERGARLATGTENVTAVYRSGIGKGGNVKAGQISIAETKPLGIRDVVNPLRASGGAPKATRDQARRQVPLALMALDRLVSVEDYGYFTQAFAGIGKARAALLTDGKRRVVHLTIAGVDDIPIDANSDLYRNLRRALSKNGDPMQPVRIDMRKLIALIISARVSIEPDYKWESVEPKIRAALLDTFSFERRELGQAVYLSEVIGTIHAVRGVRYADVDILDSISESEILDLEAIEKKANNIRGIQTEANGTVKEFKQPRPCIPAALAKDAGKNTPISPAEVAYLLPDVADTLILNNIEEVKK